MDIDSAWASYSLAAKADGKSQSALSLMEISLRHFKGFMGGIPDVSKVADDDLRRFVVAFGQRRKWQDVPDQVKPQQIRSVSVNSYAKRVKRFWVWLLEKKTISTNSLASVKLSNKGDKGVVDKVFTEEQVKAVFAQVKNLPRESALILLFLDSGITLQEIADLDVDRIDLERCEVTVFREKTQRLRSVVFSRGTAAVLANYLSVRPDPVGTTRLFLTESGYPLSKVRIQKILERVGRRASLSQRLSPHKLRHTYATMCLRYGKSLEYVSKDMGHADIRITSKNYLHVLPADMAAAAKKSSPVLNLGLARGKASLLDRPKELTPEEKAFYKLNI